MRPRAAHVAIAVGVAVLAVAGYGLSAVTSPTDTVATSTFTFTNEGVVTYTIPTVTETVTVTTTVTQPPPPPPVCDATLSPGGNVATFESSLQPGQTGCLHGGTYTGHWSLTKSGVAGSPIVLQSYPGEQAVLSIGSAGDGVSLPGTDWLVLKNLAFRNGSGNGNALVFPNSDADNDTLVGDEFGPTNGQAVFADNTTDHLIVDRNYCHDIAGVASPPQSHCFYIEGDDNRVSNNLCVTVTTGFCVQMYPVCHRGVIVSNTSVGAQQGGIVVGRETGTCDSVDVVNNIVANSPGQYAVQCYKSPTNVRVHHNLFFNAAATNCAGASSNTTADPQFVNGYHLAASSPGVDTGDPAWLYTPDLDGVTRPVNVVDRGSYER